MEFGKLDFNDSKLLCLQIAENIRKRILDKEISVGEKFPPQEDLRKIFNVGLVTVKEALSNLVKEGYISRRPHYGTFVISSEPKKGRSLEIKNEISIVVCPFKTGKAHARKHYPHIYLETLIRGIEEKVRENGAYLMYSTIEGDRLSIAGKEKDIAGLILAGHITPDIFRIAKKSKIPLVCIGDIRKRTKTEEDVDIIAMDDFMSTYLATKHLIELGHKRIIYLCQAPEYPWNREELRGYIEAHREAGIVCDKELQIKIEDQGINGGYIAISKVLEQSVSFTGIVNISSTINTGIIEALKEKGLRVPEDVSVVSVGQMPELTPSTSVTCDLEEVGRKAAERLIERIKNPDLKSERIVLPYKLVICNSTRKLEGK